MRGKGDSYIGSQGLEWTPLLSKLFSERSLGAAGSRPGLRSQLFMSKGNV